jgi:hypothetical protein
MEPRQEVALLAKSGDFTGTELCWRFAGAFMTA